MVGIKKRVRVRTEQQFTSPISLAWPEAETVVVFAWPTRISWFILAFLLGLPRTPYNRTDIGMYKLWKNKHEISLLYGAKFGWET